MSNRVRLAMTVRGDEPDVRAFIDAFQQDGFRTVAPLPDEHHVARGEDERQSIVSEAWGTKRVFHDRWPTIVTFGPSRLDARATYRFSCDWSVPRPLFSKMSSAWPKVRFLVSWSLEDNAGGRSVWHDEQETRVQADAPSMDEDDGVRWRAARDFFLNTHDAWASSDVTSSARASADVELLIRKLPPDQPGPEPIVTYADAAKATRHE